MQSSRFPVNARNAHFYTHTHFDLYKTLHVGQLGINLPVQEHSLLSRELSL